MIMYYSRRENNWSKSDQRFCMIFLKFKQEILFEKKAHKKLFFF